MMMKTSSSVKTSRSRTVNVKYDRCSARSSSACSGNHSSSNTHTSSGKDLGVSLPASSSSLVMPRRDMLASFSVAPVIAAVSAANLANPLEAYAAYGNAPGAGGAGGAAATGDASAIKFNTFYGAATSPVNYGGVGGTTKAKARYSFDYPATFTEDTVGKVDKGTKGIDCRFAGPSGERIFVISLLNEGMDSQGFNLKDPQKALSSLTNSDVLVQDLVLNAKDIKSSTSSHAGIEFLDFNVPSTQRLLVSIGLQEARIFAIFITASERAYARNPAMYQKVQETFRSYALPGGK